MGPRPETPPRRRRPTLSFPARPGFADSVPQPFQSLGFPTSASPTPASPGARVLVVCGAAARFRRRLGREAGLRAASGDKDLSVVAVTVVERHSGSNRSSRRGHERFGSTRQHAPFAHAGWTRPSHTAVVGQTTVTAKLASDSERFQTATVSDRCILKRTHQIYSYGDLVLLAMDVR